MFSNDFFHCLQIENLPLFDPVTLNLSHMLSSALGYFLLRCMECRRGLAIRILSVCLSVCQTRGL